MALNEVIIIIFTILSTDTAADQVVPHLDTNIVLREMCGMVLIMMSVAWFRVLTLGTTLLVYTNRHVIYYIALIC